MRLLSKPPLVICKSRGPQWYSVVFLLHSSHTLFVLEIHKLLPLKLILGVWYQAGE